MFEGAKIMKKSKSQGKRHNKATTNQLTKILTLLRSGEMKTLMRIRVDAEIPNDYVYPALHWLVFHKLVKKIEVARETFYYVGRKKCSKK